ncbi:MAG TPA: GNAT family N-acetyltransferase [Ktedonobacterales bacterium]
MGRVTLRPVVEADLPIIFEHQRDPEHVRMAAFPARDEAAFYAHWAKIMADESNITRTVLDDGIVVGNIGSWMASPGKREVGYGYGREHWGKGIATQALAELLREISDRPLYASVAKHNIGSLRVLEKCGFVVTGSEIIHDEQLGEEVELINLELR